MLDKNPSLRPDAIQVKTRLKAALGMADPRFFFVPAPVRHTVGRQSEMQRLQLALSAASSGTGSLVYITGEPGLGKSTLVDDFLSSVTDVTIARGRCSERLAGTEAYLPVLEAMAGLGPHDRIRRIMRVSAPTWLEESGAGSEPTVGVAASLSTATASGQERMKREILSFVSDITATRPLILFFDDVHWADSSTVDLLAYLGRHCSRLRLLLLVTCRMSP